MNTHTLPNNLEAEQSVLGSILLDNEVFSHIEGKLVAEHFYKEAHRKIFKAIEHLFNRDEPVDLVTLTEELRQTGNLESIGSVAYLIGLAEDVPTAAYAENYANIVAEKALLRELIGISRQIMQNAYDQTLPLEQILDKAESGIFKLSSNKRSDNFINMPVLVNEAFEAINKRMNSPDTVSGLKTGFTALDGITSGLQEGSLNVLAARPSMGKTALALTICQQVALNERKAVGIFSLEMSAVQLVSRMLCSLALVDMNRVRNGDLHFESFTRLGNAAGKLSEADIFIDDSAVLNVMELRSKARKLMTSHNLGLIIIDYLQLMSGGGKGGGENRQQEISNISRSLKALARELDIPVLALSQLSRAVESRPNKRPMLSDLRESGCIVDSSIIYTFEGAKELKDIRIGDRVLSYSGRKFCYKKVTNKFCTGIKQTYSLKLESGKEIIATANHKFLTQDGWKRLDELSTKDYIKTPREVLQNKNKKVKNNEIILVAHIIGDGTILEKQRTEYSTGKQELASEPVFYDRVKAIEKSNMVSVWDLTIEDTHNFVADGMIVHNSIEQDADLVMFIYRDEYYDQQSEKKGIAEIIVGKQRNGPTGSIELMFHSNYVSFHELEKSNPSVQ